LVYNWGIGKDFQSDTLAYGKYANLTEGGVPGKEKYSLNM